METLEGASRWRFSLKQANGVPKSDKSVETLRAASRWRPLKEKDIRDLKGISRWDLWMSKLMETPQRGSLTKAPAEQVDGDPPEEKSSKEPCQVTCNVDDIYASFESLMPWSPKISIRLKRHFIWLALPKFYITHEYLINFKNMKTEFKAKESILLFFSKNIRAWGAATCLKIGECQTLLLVLAAYAIS